MQAWMCMVPYPIAPRIANPGILAFFVGFLFACKENTARRDVVGGEEYQKPPRPRKMCQSTMM